MVKYLENILENEKFTIRHEVAKEALEHDDINSFFQDLLNYGCVNGTVSSLIYYSDTHKFFDLHYDEIEDIRLEYRANTGTALDIEGDLKNTLAWFSFETVASQIYQELGN